MENTFCEQLKGMGWNGPGELPRGTVEETITSRGASGIQMKYLTNEDVTVNGFHLLADLL